MLQLSQAGKTKATVLKGQVIAAPADPGQGLAHRGLQEAPPHPSPEPHLEQLLRSPLPEGLSNSLLIPSNLFNSVNSQFQKQRQQLSGPAAVFLSTSPFALFKLTKWITGS